MNWKFDIADLIVAGILGFFLGCAVRPFLTSFPTEAGFPPPASALSEPNSGAVQVTPPKMYPLKPSRFTNGTAPDFSSPSSDEASAGADSKVGPESGEIEGNADTGEVGICPHRNLPDLSGQLITNTPLSVGAGRVMPEMPDSLLPAPNIIIKKAAERNGCYGDDFLILLAVRKAENGALGKEFGVKGKAWGTDLETQAAWAAATIVKTKERWERAGRPTDFIEWLARRYCPMNSQTWERNVRFWYRRFKKC